MPSWLGFNHLYDQAHLEWWNKLSPSESSDLLFGDMIGLGQCSTYKTQLSRGLEETFKRIINQIIMITFLSFKNTLNIFCRENCESENLRGLNFHLMGNVVCWVPVPVVAMLEDLSLSQWPSLFVELSDCSAVKCSGVVGERVLAGDPLDDTSRCFSSLSSEKLSLRILKEVLGNFWKNCLCDDPDFLSSCKDSTDLHNLVFLSAIFVTRLSCQDLGLFFFLIRTISSLPNILWHSVYIRLKFSAGMFRVSCCAKSKIDEEKNRVSRNIIIFYSRHK